MEQQQKIMTLLADYGGHMTRYGLETAQGNGDTAGYAMARAMETLTRIHGEVAALIRADDQAASIAYATGSTPGPSQQMCGRAWRAAAAIGIPAPRIQDVFSAVSPPEDCQESYPSFLFHALAIAWEAVADTSGEGRC